MEWIGCVQCETFRHAFVARTFALIAPVRTDFETSFVRQQNGPKCTQRVRTHKKNEFRVPWDGSGAFVAKDFNTISWPEVLH